MFSPVFTVFPIFLHLSLLFPSSYAFSLSHLSETPFSGLLFFLSLVTWACVLSLLLPSSFLFLSNSSLLFSYLSLIISFLLLSASPLYHCISQALSYSPSSLTSSAVILFSLTFSVCLSFLHWLRYGACLGELVVWWGNNCIKNTITTIHCDKCYKRYLKFCDSICRFWV